MILSLKKEVKVVEFQTRREWYINKLEFEHGNIVS